MQCCCLLLLLFLYLYCCCLLLLIFLQIVTDFRGSNVFAVASCLPVVTLRHILVAIYIYELLLLYIYSQTAAAFTLLLALIYAVASCLTWSGLKAVKAAGLWLVLDRCLISHHLVTWNAQWAPLAICSSTESKAYKKF